MDGRNPVSRWPVRVGLVLAGAASVLLFTLAGVVVLVVLFLGSGMFDAVGKQQHLQGLVEHYAPLVAALHQYERERGRPARHVRDLVPDYLEQLPELEPETVGQFSYFPGPPWRIAVWFPDWFLDLDAPSFIYSSDWRIAVEGDSPGGRLSGWSYQPY